MISVLFNLFMMMLTQEHLSFDKNKNLLLLNHNVYFVRFSIVCALGLFLGPSYWLPIFNFLFLLCDVSKLWSCYTVFINSQFIPVSLWFGSSRKLIHFLEAFKFWGMLHLTIKDHSNVREGFIWKCKASCCDCSQVIQTHAEACMTSAIGERLCKLWMLYPSNHD